MREINPNLIRAYIDGELSPEAAQEVRAALEVQPGFRERVEFEQRMKSAVGRIMADAPAAPAALSAAIQKSIREEAAPEQAIAARAAREDRAPQPAGTAPSRAGLFAAIASLFEPIARPRPLSIGAVVAVLAIAAGSVLFGIFYRPIDALPTNGQHNLISDPAEYASQEHDRCASNPEWFHRKVNVCSPDEAAIALMDHFGVASVTIFDLTEAGYEFVGEGRCNLPETRHSAHLMYERRAEGKSRAKLSIFIAAAGGERPVIRCGTELQPGEWHRYREGSRCRKRVQLSTDNTLVYFLVTCDPNDVEPVADLVGRALVARAR